MSAKCVICKGPATKKVIWADGRAYQPSCDKHVRDTQMMLTRKNGRMTELAGVKDLSDATTLDLVASAAYPSLERKPGGPDNWIERAGGLPKYIERIAKHLHYERGMTISHAIATAVNTVRRWARMGKVAKYGDPNNKHVTPKTVAQAAAAIASWEAKKKAGKIHLTDAEFTVIDLCDVSEEFAIDLAASDKNPYCMRCGKHLGMAFHETNEHDEAAETGADLTERATLLPMDIKALAQRANQIEDPGSRAAARRKVLDLAVPKSELTVDKRKQRAKSGQAMSDGSFPIFDEQSLKSAIRLARTPAQRAHVMRRARALNLASLIPVQWRTDLSEVLAGQAIDLASTIAPRNARGRATDGRRSYKGQGKWKHGFVPANRAAQEAKAKGSPIAIKRLTRLFGSPSKPDDTSSKGGKPPALSKGRAGQRSASGRKKNTKGSVRVQEKTNPTAERANDVAFFRHQSANKDIKPTKNNTLPDSQKESSKDTRIPKRARQNWDEIPENLKTVRNGQRYVLAEFGGRGYLTKWVGGVQEQQTRNTNVQKSVTQADAEKMSSAERQRILNDPRASTDVKRVVRRVTKKGAKR